MLRWPASPAGWVPAVRPAHPPLAYWHGHGWMSSRGRRAGLRLSSLPCSRDGASAWHSVVSHDCLLSKWRLHGGGLYEKSLPQPQPCAFASFSFCFSFCKLTLCGCFS